MENGQVCFYKFETSYGVLRTYLERIEYPNEVLVEYIEFESSIVDDSINAGSSSDSPPAVGMPLRSETFLATYDRMTYQGRLF